MNAPPSPSRGRVVICVRHAADPGPQPQAHRTGPRRCGCCSSAAAAPPATRTPSTSSFPRPASRRSCSAEHGLGFRGPAPPGLRTPLRPLQAVGIEEMREACALHGVPAFPFDRPDTPAGRRGGAGAGAGCLRSVYAPGRAPGAHQLCRAAHHRRPRTGLRGALLWPAAVSAASEEALPSWQ